MSPPLSTGTSPGFSWQRWLLPAAATLVLAVFFFSPARQVADVRLDPSNYASYAFFTAKGFQYGEDVMPMAGPLGFVPYGFLYAGHLFAERFVLELVTKLFLGGLIVWFLCRSHGGWLRWVWLLALLVMAPLVEDMPYDLTLLLAGLALVHLHAVPGRKAALLASGLAAAMALLTLFKGTQATVVFATLGLVFLQACLLRDFRRLPWIFGAYLAALLLLLVAAGQNPMNFPGYLHGMLELSSGYNAAMVLEEPHAAFLTGAGSLVALEALLLLTVWPHRREPTAVAGALLVAGFTFIQWKHGFVRADGHVYIFYQYVCIAAPMILVLSRGWAATPASRTLRVVVAVLAVVAAGLGLWGDGVQSLQRHWWACTQLPHHVSAGLRQLLSPAAEKSRLQAELVRQREASQLPFVRETVGSDSIDFFGTELGYLMLNRLNYRPRPMGGGTFNVFTPWLQELNRSRLVDPARRPAWFLASLQTIDYRLLTEDDPGSLRALLEGYDPVGAEQGLVLFRARPDNPPAPEPRFLGAQPIALDRPVAVPAVGSDEILLASFSLPSSWTGRLRALLYKPSLLFMDLDGTGIRDAHHRRIIPNLVHHPIPFNPVIEDTSDLVSLYGGDAGKTVSQFTLRSEHPSEFDVDGFEVRFFAMPRPAHRSVDPILSALAFPNANVPPLLMTPANAPYRRFDGLPVQMLEPPGRIRFGLQGGENTLQFRYGMDPEAYTVGKSDGVEFIVELECPDRPPQMLFHRWLRPGREPADRGTQTAQVFLPPFPPRSTVSLRTEPGPDRDAGWDWAFYTGIRLLGHGYIPAQFPRFTAVPVKVEAAVAGALHEGDRELFMLNSPGSLTFALKGTEKKLRFTAGLLPGAYTNGGGSDGVDFIVELQDPAGNKRLIYQSYLNPRDNGADRGDRPFSVDIPAFAPGTLLVFTIAAGPNGSNAWDWSYIESLHLE